MTATITTVNATYAENFIRSAIAPETMVAAVIANTAPNSQLIQAGELASGAPRWPNAAPMSTATPPVVACPTTVATAAPTRKNTSTPSDQSIMFFITTLAVFFALTWPASSSANPGCMKKIMNETTSTQIQLMLLAMCSAGVWRTTGSTDTTPRRRGSCNLRVRSLIRVFASYCCALLDLGECIRP